MSCRLLKSVNFWSMRDIWLLYRNWHTLNLHCDLTVRCSLRSTKPFHCHKLILRLELRIFKYILADLFEKDIRSHFFCCYIFFWERFLCNEDAIYNICFTVYLTFLPLAFLCRLCYQYVKLFIKIISNQIFICRDYLVKNVGVSTRDLENLDEVIIPDLEEDQFEDFLK